MKKQIFEYYLDGNKKEKKEVIDNDWYKQNPGIHAETQRERKGNDNKILKGWISFVQTVGRVLQEEWVWLSGIRHRKRRVAWADPIGRMAMNLFSNLYNDEQEIKEWLSTDEEAVLAFEKAFPTSRENVNLEQLRDWLLQDEESAKRYREFHYEKQWSLKEN